MVSMLLAFLFLPYLVVRSGLVDGPGRATGFPTACPTPYHLAQLQTSRSASLFHLAHIFRRYRTIYAEPPTPELLHIESVAFPFDRASTGLLVKVRDSYEGRGIVFALGHREIHLLLPLVKTLALLKCTLPIQVVYRGSQDLTANHIQLLRQWIPRLSLVDISQRLAPGLQRLSGSDMKVAALYFSTFREVVLIDAAVALLVDPELFFQHVAFLQTGMLCFPDVPAEPRPDYVRLEAWIQSFVPDFDASAASPRVRMFANGTSHSLIASGVVVLDKHERFLSLLGMLSLLLPTNRRMFDAQRFLGAKEIFWFATLMMHEPLGLHGELPGRLQCGAQSCTLRSVHHSAFKHVWWLSQGAVLRNKDAPAQGHVDLSAIGWYACDGRHLFCDSGDEAEDGTLAPVHLFSAVDVVVANQYTKVSRGLQLVCAQRFAKHQPEESDWMLAYGCFPPGERSSERSESIPGTRFDWPRLRRWFSLEIDAMEAARQRCE
jgi:hypothetical protein